MSIKKNINKLIGLSGYQISKIDNLKNRLKKNSYKWLQNLKINTVLDIGANVGQFADFSLNVFPKAMVYSFEPIQNCFVEFDCKFKNNPRIRGFNIGLGREETDMELNINSLPASSSILELAPRHKRAFPSALETNKEKIKIRTLDSFLNQINYLPSVLMKIDVQGSELEVLYGATKTLDLINIIIVETSFYELYKSQPLFDEIYNFLLDKKFFFKGSFDQLYDPLNGQILQSDSIFIKNLK